MNSLDNKIAQFAVALQDMYRDEEDREGHCLTKIELTEDSLTEDFTAMFYAVFFTYRDVTGDEVDILDFVAICNKLAVQKLRELDKEKEKTE